MLSKKLLVVAHLVGSTCAVAGNLLPLFNLAKTHPTKQCAAPACLDHLLASESEIPRLLELGYATYGVGGELNGGHIGCVFEHNTSNYKNIQRRFNPIELAHIAVTDWEIESNFHDILSRFSENRVHVGYLSATNKDLQMVPLVRAYSRAYNDHVLFGADARGYEGERSRVYSESYNSYVKTIGFMYPRGACEVSK